MSQRVEEMLDDYSDNDEEEDEDVNGIRNFALKNSLLSQPRSIIFGDKHPKVLKDNGLMEAAMTAFELPELDDTDFYEDIGEDPKNGKEEEAGGSKWGKIENNIATTTLEEEDGQGIDLMIKPEDLLSPSRSSSSPRSGSSSGTPKQKVVSKWGQAMSPNRSASSSETGGALEEIYVPPEGTENVQLSDYSEDVSDPPDSPSPCGRRRKAMHGGSSSTGTEKKIAGVLKKKTNYNPPKTSQFTSLSPTMTASSTSKKVKKKTTRIKWADDCGLPMFSYAYPKNSTIRDMLHRAAERQKTVIPLSDRPKTTHILKEEEKPMNATSSYLITRRHHSDGWEYYKYEFGEPRKYTFWEPPCAEEGKNNNDVAELSGYFRSWSQVSSSSSRRKDPVPRAPTVPAWVIREETRQDWEQHDHHQTKMQIVHLPQNPADLMHPSVVIPKGYHLVTIEI